MEHYWFVGIWCILQYIGQGRGQSSECRTYTTINDPTRKDTYTGSYTCDNGLQTKWYRFITPGSTMMSVSCVYYNYCGTQATGWLSGQHPTVAQGIVTRKVCFNHGAGCCGYSNNIRVRNCGQFYVYELQVPTAGCNLRYCTTATAITDYNDCTSGTHNCDAKSTCQTAAVEGFTCVGSECSTYTTINDPTRKDTYSGSITCDNGLQTKWYRFITPGSTMMLVTCVSYNYCGTNYTGWLSGQHPTVAQGILTRKVCFSFKNSYGCCPYSNNIRVRNCGQFYVYELKTPPSCSLRYCTTALADENECSSGTHNCHRDANCQDVLMSFTCTCKPGYIGNGVNCQGASLSSISTTTIVLGVAVGIFCLLSVSFIIVKTIKRKRANYIKRKQSQTALSFGKQGMDNKAVEMDPCT